MRACRNPTSKCSRVDSEEQIIKSDLMDYETMGADAFGRSLRGIGLNLLVRDVRGLAEFLVCI